MSRANDAGAVKVGLAGCGAVADQYYGPALRELERAGVVRVVALYDPERARVGEIGKLFPRAERAAGIARFGDTGVELAIVASPPRHHAEQTMALLERGMDVLCEKPMAPSLAEGLAMVRSASATGRMLAVGLVRRFFPATRTIRALLSGGQLGAVRSFHVSEGGAFRWPARSASFFEKSSLGGGVLLDIGVHVLDLLGWWWGPPVAVEYEDDAMGGVEANCRVHLAYDGFAGSVRLTREGALPGRTVIECERGWMAYDIAHVNRLRIGLVDAEFALDGLLHHAGHRGGRPILLERGGNFQQSFLAQLADVAGAVRRRVAPAVPAEEGIASLALIERCRERRTLMAMPWLDAEERAGAERLGTGAAG